MVDSQTHPSKSPSNSNAGLFLVGVFGGVLFFCCGGPLLLLPSKAKQSKQTKELFTLEEFARDRASLEAGHLRDANELEDRGFAYSPFIGQEYVTNSPIRRYIKRSQNGDDSITVLLLLQKGPFPEYLRER
jgi:hypothetical protein